MKRTSLVFFAAAIAAGQFAATLAEAQVRKAPLSAARERLAAKADTGASSRVAGGATVIRGSYPFQVALVLAEAGQGDELSGFICGGTLVSPRHVLTAAHCLDGEGAVQSQPADIDIYAGSTNFRGGERLKVKRIERHPEWNAQTLSGDIAVLELEREAAGAGVSTITVRGADNALPASAMVIGWGATGPGGGPSRVMREVELQVTDRARCLDQHATWRNGYASQIVSEIGHAVGLSKATEAAILKRAVEKAGPALAPGVVCAGSQIAGRSSCYGDSGGPLFSRSADDKPMQIGVVSWGVGCDTRQVNAVFTDVAAYADWIRAQTR
jgi:secreted trypsin-like serine protease